MLLLAARARSCAYGVLTIAFVLKLLLSTVTVYTAVQAYLGALCRWHSAISCR